eukprot:scaffold99206_cov35-Tisochrysis_lutea.AAC.3
MAIALTVAAASRLGRCWLADSETTSAAAVLTPTAASRRRRADISAVSRSIPFLSPLPSCSGFLLVLV